MERCGGDIQRDIKASRGPVAWTEVSAAGDVEPGPSPAFKGALPEGFQGRISAHHPGYRPAMGAAFFSIGLPVVGGVFCLIVHGVSYGFFRGNGGPKPAVGTTPSAAKLRSLRWREEVGATEHVVGRRVGVGLLLVVTEDRRLLVEQVVDAKAHAIVVGTA